MTDAQRAIEEALTEIERLRQVLRRGKSKQVSADDDRRIIKATALTWFHTHRPIVLGTLSADLLSGIDENYKALLGASEKATLRARHLNSLKTIRGNLARCQIDHVVSLSLKPAQEKTTADTPPAFAPLVPDPAMQAILTSRWGECVNCVEAGAPLAAVVMMGGMLEGLLLARVNQLADKRQVFKAVSAPKDKAGTPLKLNEWGLKNYLDVAHELAWISKTTRDVGEVVRDYRNYIHPQKEHSHGIEISADDAATLWEIVKSIARQILKP